MIPSHGRIFRQLTLVRFTLDGIPILTGHLNRRALQALKELRFKLLFGSRLLRLADYAHMLARRCESFHCHLVSTNDLISSGMEIFIVVMVGILLECHFTSHVSSSQEKRPFWIFDLPAKFLYKRAR